MKRFSTKGFTLIELIIVIVIMLILGAILLPMVGFYGNNSLISGDHNEATKLLETAYMFTDIKIIGPAPFICHEDDIFSTEFRALNMKGIPVHGVVCKGYTGEQTVRFAP